jgi:hypothetical protein
MAVSAPLASAEAGAPEEVEITPEMMEAGLLAWSEWNPRVEEREGAVNGIYEAMEKVRRSYLGRV